MNSEELREYSQRTASTEMYEEAIKGLDDVPSLMQSVGRGIELSRRCKYGSAKHTEYEQFILRATNKVYDTIGHVKLQLKTSREIELAKNKYLDRLRLAARRYITAMEVFTPPNDESDDILEVFASRTELQKILGENWSTKDL